MGVHNIEIDHLSSGYNHTLIIADIYKRGKVN